ncbi:hypothetical protein HTG_05765 [Natrinema mahii]|nr:hypothetical protein HTG_05765 [Natrinema mahii]
MTRPSRRTLLSTTAGLLALSAGCIADSTGDSPDEDDESDDPSEDDPGSDDDGSEDLPEEVTGYETQNYQFSTDTETETSSVDLVRDADDATEWLETRTLSDTDPLTGFVDDTDFETSILVSLESEAPNPCYELVLESIDVQPIEDDETDEGSETDGDDEPSSSSTGDDETDSDGTDGSADKELVLEAGVRDTADENEACTPVITTVGRLVRVTFESEPLTALSATVVDHEGNKSGASMRSDSASASESTSVESDDGTAEDGS